MSRLSWKFSSLIAAAASLLGPACGFAGVEPRDLRCEYRVNPLGIDAAEPRLSWIVASDERGQRQSAYQVLVASDESKLAEGQADLWDSGKVASDQTNQIEYQGKPLASGARCSWKVRAWDKDGKPSEWSPPALWTMGLLKKSDWQAKWIGYDEAVAKPSIDLDGCKWVWYPEGDARTSAPVGKVFFRHKLAIPADRKIRSAEFLLLAPTTSSSCSSTRQRWPRSRACRTAGNRP